MPPVHRFLGLQQARLEARHHASLGLHLGLDLDEPSLLFGTGWDRDARDFGREMRQLGVRCVARGPDAELPLHARDPVVREQVRSCHDRAMAAAMHLGCSHYLVRMGSLHGLSRSDRLSRREHAVRNLEDLECRAHDRGLHLVVQHWLEPDGESLDLWLDALRHPGAGVIFSPARALWARFQGVDLLVQHLGERLVGLDLSDFRRIDLEPREPGSGVLSEWRDLSALLARPSIEVCTVDLPRGSTTEGLVPALNRLVAGTEPVEPSAIVPPDQRK